VTDESSRQRSYYFAGLFSNSVHMLKFRGKGQIPWLSSKFRGLKKTVGPTYIIQLVTLCSICLKPESYKFMPEVNEHCVIMNK